MFKSINPQSVSIYEKLKNRIDTPKPKLQKATFLEYGAEQNLAQTERQEGTTATSTAVKEYTSPRHSKKRTSMCFEKFSFKVFTLGSVYFRSVVSSPFFWKDYHPTSIVYLKGDFLCCFPSSYIRAISSSQIHGWHKGLKHTRVDVPLFFLHPW